MSSQLWLCMSGYLKYILSTYMFISYFFSLKKQAEENLNNLVQLRKAGYLNYIPSRYAFISCGTKTEQTDMATYGRRIHVNIYFWVRFEYSNVASYGGISKLYIIQIQIYLFFCFTEKLRGSKMNNMMWLRMAGSFMSIQINMSQICTFWTKRKGYHITRLV